MQAGHLPATQQPLKNRKEAVTGKKQVTAFLWLTSEEHSFCQVFLTPRSTSCPPCLCTRYAGCEEGL